jgi:hypothetical protein
LFEKINSRPIGAFWETVIAIFAIRVNGFDRERLATVVARRIDEALRV